jgi:hypothetical protein
MHRATSTTVPALLAAGVLLLAGCGSGDDSSADNGTTAAPATSTAAATAPETVTETVTAPAPPNAPAPTTGDNGDGGGNGGGGNGGGGDNCSGLTGKDAVMRWYEEVPLPEQGYPYAPGAATVETYDPCAALSAVTLPVAHATASSPTQVMLFHDGQYIGTATEKAYGFYPEIERLADNELQVTWSWPQDGDANANPTGRSTATFTWDDAAGRVVMAGEVPPV